MEVTPNECAGLLAVRAKIRGTLRSTTVPNVAYKRSSCETFFTTLDGGTKKEKTKKERGRPVENDVAVEILKNRIPTATCKSLRKKRFGFRTFSTGPAAIHDSLTRRETFAMRAKNAFLV